MEGNVAGNIFENDRVYPVRLIYPNAKNRSLVDIQKLSIASPDGRLKPINELAELQIKPGAAQIERENLQSMGVVSARLQNRDLGSTMKEIEKVLFCITLPSQTQIQ